MSDVSRLLSPSLKQRLEKYLKLSYGPFLPHHFQFLVTNYNVIQYYIISATELDMPLIHQIIITITTTTLIIIIIIIII
jgi:hypothetical protein